ncbi:MAG TPA: pyrroline-5-carboxylate reductase [Sulfurimonas sp.]|nr:pyrroline-5-carboxylate reductase [Sulfurimonas sp.]
MTKTITFIGNGNMALAIALGLKEDYTIEVVGRNPKNLDKFEKALGQSISKHPIQNFDISNKTIIFAVKPQNLEEVSKQFLGKAESVYSILAGTKLENLEKNIQAKAYVRAMPNMAASVQKSMTTLTGNLSLQAESIELFSAIGKAHWLGSEKEIDIATALAGSGPAYLALIAEALTDGAVKQGLKRVDAMSIMRGLFDGFGSLIQETHPALLKDAVMSPGGTTAAGYCAMEESGVRDGCIKAIEKANERAKALS